MLNGTKMKRASRRRTFTLQRAPFARERSCGAGVLDRQSGAIKVASMKGANNANEPAPSTELEFGTVIRLDPEWRFGYVQDAMRENAYIFLAGRALKNREMGKLAVGMRVQFQLSDQGRIDELRRTDS